MLVSMDYVFGSGQWPKFDFKPVEFNSEKFMTDMYNDKAKSGSGKEAEQKGKWVEKNSAAAEPPPKASVPGNAVPGKAPAASAAKSKPVSSKKSGKPVDPNAKTKEGKSVKQLQDEATKKGKKMPGGEIKPGAGKEGAAEKGKGKQAKDEEIKQALTALEQVTTRYAKDGATKEEVITGVKAVRRKFSKVFKSIEVIDGGDTWDYEYVMNPKSKKKGPKKAEWPAGTKDDPIPIKWYKPKGLYPTVDGATPTQGVQLPATPRKPARWLQVAADNFLDKGDIVRHRDGPRPDEAKKEDIKHQLDAAVDSGMKVSDKEYAIDHVRDLGWYGQDVYVNLWPLNPKQNNDVNASHYQQARAKLRDDHDTRAAKNWNDRYFWIAKVEMPPGSPGGHKTDKDNPVNSGKAGIPKRKP